MRSKFRPVCTPRIPFLAALLLFACDKDKPPKSEAGDAGTLTHDTGPAPDTDPDCDTGHLDDDGECVPAACGTGTWGNLELDESTVYVDIAAAEGGDGSEAAPFTSIQAGLDAAGDADGGMVAVAAGNYAETLELGRSHDGVHLAGRCRELVAIDASEGGGSTPGIYVAVNASEVEISGVTVSGSQSAGVAVGSGAAKIRDTAVVESEYYGIVAFQTGIHPTALTMEGCEIRGNTTVGVLVYGSGTSVTLQETAIEDTRSDRSGETGQGLEVWGGASLVAEACEVRGNTTLGVVVADSGTSVTLRETFIVDTQPDENGNSGCGIQVSLGASLDAEACEIRGNASAGLLAGDSGTVVTLRETAIEGTQPDGKGEAGYGIQVSEGASLDAEACVVGGNSSAGVSAPHSGTTVTLRETAIADTQPDENGERGYGIEVWDGASLDAEACEVRENTGAGVIAYDSGTLVTIRETSIEGTQPGESGEDGLGIVVWDGASLVAEACEVRGNTTLGAAAADSGTSLTLRETSIEDTQPRNDGEGGFGIQVTDGASLDAEACEVSGNSNVGVAAANSGTSVSLRGSGIKDTQPDQNGESGYGMQIQDGASLDAEACELIGNTSAGVGAVHSGTSVSLRETTIEDTQPDENGELGYGIQVSEGASLDAEACTIRENTSEGVIAGPSGTSVTLRDTTID